MSFVAASIEKQYKPFGRKEVSLIVFQKKNWETDVFSGLTF